MAFLAADSTLPKLSDHFPRVEKPCSKVAKVFFECFSEEGKMKSPEVKGPFPANIWTLKPHDTTILQDADAGRRGLLKCLDKMKTYDKCMNRVSGKMKIPKELYRVSQPPLSFLKTCTFNP